MEQNTRRGVTLAAVLSLLQPNVFIMHRISLHELEAGGGTMSTCKGCGAEIGWIRTKDGRYMPVELEPVLSLRRTAQAAMSLTREKSLPDVTPSCQNKTYFAK